MPNLLARFYPISTSVSFTSSPFFSAPSARIGIMSKVNSPDQSLKPGSDCTAEQVSYIHTHTHIQSTPPFHLFGMRFGVISTALSQTWLANGASLLGSSSRAQHGTIHSNTIYVTMYVGRTCPPTYLHPYAPRIDKASLHV